MKKVAALSVFFPAYNEEKNIKSTILQAVKVLNQIAKIWEILVINDGSTDKTAEIVKKLSKKDKRVKLLNHKKNRGYGAALKTGLFKSRYPLICYTDSDGQFNIEEIKKFLPQIKFYDLVIGYREKRTDKLFRRILANILRGANLILFGLHFQDIDCGFKLFKKEVVDKIGKLETESAITETEFVLRAKRMGFKIAQVGVGHNSRLLGEQTGGKFKIIFKAGLEAFKLRLLLLREAKMEQKRKTLFLIVLMVLAAFLRLYRLEELMTYLGDEGRDMLIVLDIIQGKNFPFIGPPTSVGKLYLGPIYYYFIAPFAYLFAMSPVGPAFFVVLTGIFSVWLIYLVGKKYFNSFTGLVSATFLALSPLMVTFSRSSWNPNPVPFFLLLLLLFFYYWQQTKKEKFLYFTIICFAIMLQLHYLVILMLPFIAFNALKLTRQFHHKKSLFVAFFIFILMMSPLFIFDLKHNFINTKGIFNIFRARSYQGFDLFDLLSRSRDRVRQLFSLFYGFAERGWPTNILVISSLSFLFFNIWQKKKKDCLFIYGWFLWGIFMLGLYRDSIYPHYLGFLFVFPALLMSHFLSFLWKKGKLTQLLSMTIIIWLSFNLGKTTWKQLSSPPALNIRVVKNIVQLINKESQGQPFNFSLLAKNNYDDSYRYFFHLWEVPAVYKNEVTQQLFVVCEDLDICQPQGNPKWEIALFDAAYQGKIDLVKEWSPEPLIRVFKFIPKQD